MAELINKLNVKYNNIVDECICYTTSDEATPKTISNGSFWKIKNNNTVCYLGLWPTNENQDSGFHSKLKIKKNGIEYYVEKKVLNEFTVIIEQSEHQTIKVICNGYTYTETFKALAGSQFTVIVEPEIGYTAGKPNYSNGYITNDIIISASYASLEAYYITLISGNNQTLKVTLNNNENLSYTSSFTASYGDTYIVEIIPDEGYEAGSLISGNMNGTISGNLTIQVSDATIKQFTVTITQSKNQTIKVTCNGTAHTSSFTANYGSTYTTTITPNTGYNAGTLNHTSGTVTGDLTISATAAIIKQFTVTITQSSNQTITVKCNNQSHTSSFTANYGSTYTATVTPKTGYNAGTLNHTSGTITGNITISATAATIKQFTVTITQSSNQTITVKCNGINHTSSFKANYGSTYTASIAVSNSVYYTPGTLNHTSGTITGNITISATAATLKKYTITVTQPANGKITVNGSVGTSFTYNAGTSVKVQATANSGYKVTALNVNKTTNVLSANIENIRGNAN